jgi:hypothetical protein
MTSVAVADVVPTPHITSHSQALSSPAWVSVMGCTTPDIAATYAVPPACTPMRERGMVYVTLLIGGSWCALSLKSHGFTAPSLPRGMAAAELRTASWVLAIHQYSPGGLVRRARTARQGKEFKSAILPQSRGKDQRRCGPLRDWRTEPDTRRIIGRRCIVPPRAR